MQIWKTFRGKEIEKEMLKLSKDKIKLAIVVTTKSGEMIAAEKYDAAAAQEKNGAVHAFLRIGKIFCEKDNYFYDLEHTQIYLEDIETLAVCDRWVSESDDPEKTLNAGMNIRVFRHDFDTITEGEITCVTFLDIVVRTADGEVSIPVSKIRSLVVL